MKKDAVVALVAVLIVAATAWGLDQMRPDLPNRPSHPFVAHAAGPGKKVVKPGDKIVMHINGEPVTQSEFELLAQAAPEENRGFFTTPEGKRMLAEEMVKVKVLEQEGRRLGVANDPEVQAQMNTLSSQVLAGRTLEKLMKDAVEQRLQAEYEKEKANAKTLRHILVAYQGGAIPPKTGQASSPEQATQKAAAIARRIRAGADFGQVAQQESDDQQTAERGGTLGPFQPQQLPPHIGAVVNQLQPRQVSDPVRTEYGIHVFMIDSPSLEELRPQLTQRVQRAVMEEVVSGLQKGAKVDMDPDYFGAEKPRAQEPTKSNG